MRKTRRYLKALAGRQLGANVCRTLAAEARGCRKGKGWKMGDGKKEAGPRQRTFGRKLPTLLAVEILLWRRPG